MPLELSVFCSDCLLADACRYTEDKEQCPYVRIARLRETDPCSDCACQDCEDCVDCPLAEA